MPLMHRIKDNKETDNREFQHCSWQLLHIKQMIHLLAIEKSAH